MTILMMTSTIITITSTIITTIITAITIAMTDGINGMKGSAACRLL